MKINYHIDYETDYEKSEAALIFLEKLGIDITSLETDSWNNRLFAINLANLLKDQSKLQKLITKLKWRLFW
jgi:hypothetical protein